MPGTHRYSALTYNKGDRVWNYYDREYGVIMWDPSEFDLAEPPEDRWYSVLLDSGRTTTLNPERMVPADAPEAGS